MSCEALVKLLALFGVQVGALHMLIGISLTLVESVAEPAFVEGKREELSLQVFIDLASLASSSRSFDQPRQSLLSSRMQSWELS